MKPFMIAASDLIKQVSYRGKKDLIELLYYS